MATASVLAAVVVAVGMIGAVVELPKILSHHINQPVQRRERERALRRKLALWCSGAALAGGLAYLAFVV